jgi:hypothetical protein
MRVSDRPKECLRQRASVATGELPGDSLEYGDQKRGRACVRNSERSMSRFPESAVPPKDVHENCFERTHSVDTMRRFSRPPSLHVCDNDQSAATWTSAALASRRRSGCDIAP